MRGLKLLKGNELHLFGTVMPDDWIWDSDTGYFSSVMVIDALSQMNGDIVVRVNSDGGNPVEAEAIRAAFASHQGDVTVKVQGAAHSAASLMIMSANTIEMSAGSLMLIHDPSAYVRGNPEQMEAARKELEQMAEVYASVYAARSGKTPDEARAIMKEGVTLSPTQAVDEGFADLISDDVDVINSSDLAPAEMHANAMAAAMAAQGAVVAAQMKFEAAAVDGAAVSDGGQGRETGQEIDAQTNKGKMMSKTTKTAAIAGVGAVTAVVAGAVSDDATMQAVADDRARGKEIREMAAPFMSFMSQDDVDALVDNGTSVEDARKTVMNAAAAGQVKTSRVEITRDETDTKMQGMVGALMHRADPRQFKMEGPATDYRGLRVKSLAMHLAGGKQGFNEFDVIKAGMLSTTMTGGALGISDFAYITTEVMNRVLQATYARRPATWRQISRGRSATDFRTLHSITAGGDFELKTVNENGEYLQSKITDEANGLKLAKYGRQINLTFEAVINDDMGVFERLPADFARAAATLESKIAWGLIRSNAKAGDGKALFHADHSNTAGAAAISVASVGAGRKAMWEQRPAGSVDKDDFIEVEPNLLFVPPALETAAGQFVAEATPTKVSDANPFRTSVTPVTEARLGASAGGDDAKWYLFSSDLPVLEHAYLDGYEAPTVQTKDGMNPDGVNMVARHIFAATIAEFRGAYRNG